MKRIGTFVLAGLVCLLIAVIGGWLWGSTGKPELLRSLAEAELRLALTEARCSVLDGRISVYNINFGDASRQFEQAKAPLLRVKTRLEQGPLQGAAPRVAAIVTAVEEAQRMAAKLDQTANTRAAAAEKELAAVLASLPVSSPAP